MSKKRYLCIVGTCACLMAATLSGCGEKVTAEELMKEAQEKVAEVNSYKGSVDMGMELGVNDGEEPMNIGMDMSMDIEMVQDPMMYYMGGSINIDSLGVAMDMKTYGEVKDNEMITYVNMLGEWQKTTTEMDVEETTNQMLELDAFLMDGKEMTLAEKTEEYNGKAVYVLTTTFTGDDFEEIFQKMLETMSEEMGDLGSLEELGMDIDYKDTAIDMTYKIYKDSRLPAVVSMSMAKDSALTMSMEGVEMSLEKLSCDMAYAEYGTIDSIEIPEEAKNAEEISDDLGLEGYVQDENGNYVMSDYEDKGTIAIAPLEGFVISDYSTAYDVVFELQDTKSADHTCQIMYGLTALSDEWTEKDIEDTYASNEEFYTEEYGYYDVECSDVKTIKSDDHDIKYVTVTYNVGDKYLYKECNAWMVLDNGFAVECWFTESYTDENDMTLSEDTIKLAMNAVQ